MNKPTKADIRESLFRTGVLLKGLNALLEIAGGIALWIVSPGGFIVYQIYRFTLTGSIALIALTVFDLIVIWLIWLEYRAVRSRPE